MKITTIDDINTAFITNKLTDLTIGYFDGIHLGHQKIISLVSSSENYKVLITFNHHPNKQEIMQIEQKLNVLEQYQFDEVIIINMNDVNRQKTPEQFINFIAKFNLNKLFLGSDFRFGKNAAGTIDQLKEQFNVEVVDFVENSKGKISSTELRNALINRELETYKLLTGRNFIVQGMVVYGDQIGRTINFPTANLDIEDVLLGNGVYLTKVKIKNKIYNAITNVGNRPTVNGKKNKIESHIIDFNDIIYNMNIEVEFIKFIRNELKFNSLEELKLQIEKDKITAKEYYGNKTIN